MDSGNLGPWLKQLAQSDDTGMCDAAVEELALGWKR